MEAQVEQVVGTSATLLHTLVDRLRCLISSVSEQVSTDFVAT